MEWIFLTLAVFALGLIFLTSVIVTAIGHGCKIVKKWFKKDDD